MYGIASPGSGRSHVLSYMVTDHFPGTSVTLLMIISSARSVRAFAMHARSWRGADGAGRRTRQDRKGVRRRVYGMHFVRGRPQDSSAVISNLMDRRMHVFRVTTNSLLSPTVFIMRPNGPDKVRVI